MSDTDENQEGVPLFEELSDTPQSRGASLGKRKRGDATDENEKAAARKADKKQRRKKKPKDIDDGNLDSELGINRAIAYMDSRLMADHIAQRTRRFQPDLSAIEAGDIHISESAIRDTSRWDAPRTTDKISEFIEKFSGPKRKKKGANKLSDAPAEKGSPHTIVVAGAGLRAADLTRALRKFQTKEAMVAKLFAKHIKLKEAIETTTATRMSLGIGTPQRLIDLLEDGALKSDKLERVVIDASHIDIKKRGILDMKEIQVPLVQLLNRPELKDRYGTGELELLFY